MARVALLLLVSLALAGAAMLPMPPSVRDNSIGPRFGISTKETGDDGAIFIDDSHMHPVAPFERLGLDKEDSLDSPTVSPEHSAEKTSEYWRDAARRRVDYLVHRQEIDTRAKNVILFLGDGMSVPTLAATRVYMGGEERELSFEKFPYVGLSKTYCVNTQVADSACSATAYLCGVKANLGTMGLNANVTRKDCKGQNFKGNHVDSIVSWAQSAGMSTGVVTTTRVTHASPGGAYAHIADRTWEADDAVKTDNLNSEECKDIAQQLVTELPGKNIDVILGGGRANFLPKVNTQTSRQDGRNLIEEWKLNKAQQNQKAAYVQTRQELLGVDKKTTDSLLGLFDPSHMRYALENSTTQPSLAEMTQAAIEILSKNEKGFFLFVEGGRIDHGHHDAMPHLALDETKRFSDAVQKAVDLTEERDTLIVVTSDHAHTMSLAGYARRGQNIFKFAGTSDLDSLPYTTLAYGNGPGYEATKEGKRPVLSEGQLMEPKTKYPTTAPLTSETHGGDDVAIFARGPWAHLYSGVHEQSVIPHVMAYAAAIGEYSEIRARAPSVAALARASAGVVGASAGSVLLVLALRP